MNKTLSEARLRPSELEALKNYKLDHALDEMFAAKDQLRDLYDPLLEHFAAPPPARGPAPQTGRGPQFPQPGHHLHRLGHW